MTLCARCLGTGFLLHFAYLIGVEA